ncbi:ABC transporter substrate-binding protein [Arthrobacter crystallopoietes]|nr:ABC transporter substrate-binding protein [Arthrobacter crystallopoietes]AUI53757.1 hypothetical protein AC20117_22670 [Arthrobacter crystallopoietes]
MKTISIAVSQWPSLAFAVPYHVAMEKGYFEDEGINIEEVIAGSGGGTTVRSVLAGDLAFGEVATSALVESQDAGSTLVAVGGGSQQVGEVVWVAPQNSSLESIEDLAGKNVGYTNPGSVTESALAIALDRAGVDASTLEQRATGGVSEGLTAMEGGAVDATIHSDPLYAAQDDKYKLLWRSTDYITNYQQTIIVTSPTLVEEDPELVTSFLTARARALEFMETNPEESAKIWSEKGEVPLDAAQQTMKSLLEVEQWNVGFNPDGLATAQEGMRAAGLLEGNEAIDWSTYINQDFLPEGIERVELP